MPHEDIHEDQTHQGFKTWWDSLTPEQRHQRAARHQGGPDPVRILREAGGPEQRRFIAEGFDSFEFTWSYAIRVPYEAELTAQAIGDGMRLSLSKPAGFARTNRDHDTAAVVLDEDDARAFRQAFARMRSHEWVEEFMPPRDVIVCDGYGWRLKVRRGSSWYECSGSNAEPQELLDFLTYAEELGLSTGYPGSRKW